MKICRKCNKEFKDAYLYCPKCGTPHNPNMKYAKVPGQIIGGDGATFKKIIDLIFYIIGGLFILGALLSFKESVFTGIAGILLGLSLFPIGYQLFNEKIYDLKKDGTLALRIFLPFLFFMIFGISLVNIEVQEPEKNEEESNISEKIELKENDDESSNENNTIKEDEKKEEPKKKIYKLDYNQLGEYGKKQEYEGADDFFYYFPNGTYKVTRTSGFDKICFLWTFYKKSYKGTWGTEYDLKDKFTFLSNGQSETITITNDVMIYNSNKCSYEFEEK